MEMKGALNRSLLVLVGACLLLTLTRPQPAWADGSGAGAQYSCDTQRHVFELWPFDSWGDEPPPTLKPGFHAIDPHHPAISCNLGTHTLQGKIEVFAPLRGRCMGGGFVRIDSLSMEDVELVPDAPIFNWECAGGDYVLKVVRVTLKDSRLVLELCDARAYSKPEIETPRCKSQEMNIDSVAAAAKAKVAPNLADPATQAAQAPSHLPLDNDFANVFRATDAIPACAHWISLFQRDRRPYTVRDLTPHGRIAGTVGDRVYIHPANPQVCDANTESMCKAKAYLIPGDRIDVGLICGQWTYIRYVPPTNDSRPTVGWVETNRLYAVDSLITATASPERPGAIKPNEVAALKIAIRDRQIDVVKTLATRVDIKANCGALVDWAVFTSQPVLDALTRSGLDLGCEKGALLMLAGVDRIGDLESRLSDWGSWAPLSDLPARARQLLAAGIPVDGSRPDGSTALFQTIQPNNVDIAQLLLQAGANPNVVLHPDPDTTDYSRGPTALIQAVVNYEFHLDPTLVRLLLEAGANPNFRSAGEYINDPDMNSGVRNQLAGVTALHIAAEHGYLSISKLLLDHGADPHMARSDGALPADIARKNRHKDVAALIDSYASRAKVSAPAASAAVPVNRASGPAQGPAP
jgi:hypothetical protein